MTQRLKDTTTQRYDSKIQRPKDTKTQIYDYFQNVYREHFNSVFFVSSAYSEIRPLPVSAARVQAGALVADAQHADQDHRELHGRPGQPDARPRHHRLHLRRGRHAAVWEELPGSDSDL